MVERTRKQLKYTYLHPFANRQSKNSLAEVVLLIQIRNHGGTAGCNSDIFGLCLYEAGFSVQKIRQSFFDIKEFLKKLLHIIDLCSQVVVKEVLLTTILTIKTYFSLITIRSKDYLQFISIKHSFQLIITIKITMIMIISIIIIIIIISCYSNGYIGDLPGVFSV